MVEYGEHELGLVLQALERTEAHLTAAVVSRDIEFQNHVLGHTVNGTTYSGIRARTTGAPQNHWFGPAGDPRSVSKLTIVLLCADADADADADERLLAFFTEVRVLGRQKQLSSCGHVTGRSSMTRDLLAHIGPLPLPHESLRHLLALIVK